MTGKGPLWLPHDFRREAWMGQSVTKKDEWKSPTGYHFHNFFMSGEEIRFKYATYGHANSKARKNSLRHIHDGGDLEGDLEMAVMCAFGNHTKKTERNFESIGGTSRPIYYLNEEARQERHSVWQDIVRKEEEQIRYNPLVIKVDGNDVRGKKPCPFCEGKGGIADLDLVVPKTGGNTCRSLKWMATTEYVDGSDACVIIQKEERVCCPDQINNNHLLQQHNDYALRRPNSNNKE